MALGACVREHPACYAPAWSSDGRKLFYAYARYDGSLAVREVEVATGAGRDISTAALKCRAAALALSPSGERLACVAVASGQAGTGARPAQAELYVLGRAGSAEAPLWRGPTARGKVDVAWMPDGRALVVAADSPGGARVLRVGVEDHRVAVVVDGLAEVRAPAPSPDGRLVAFVARARRGVPWALFVASSEGGARKRLAPALFEDYRVGYWPAWSPDGKLLAYVAERYLSPGHAEVWAWEKASGSRRALARCLAGSCFAPTWSPTGGRLAFVRCPFGSEGVVPGTKGWPADIVVVDADGANERTIVADGLGNLMPSWSPDGRTIAWNVLGAPEAGPHTVEVADVATCATRLAGRDAASGLLLALARLRRGKPGAAARAAALAAQLGEHPVAARAHAMLAAHYRALGDWSRAAAHGAMAARALGGAERLGAMRLLADARMRLGDAEGALAACESILAAGDDPAAARLRRRLQSGLAAAARLEAAIATKPTPTLMLRLATVRLRQLGHPAGALRTVLRLIREFPEGEHLGPAARLVFETSRRMGPANLNGQLLEWAARALGPEGLRPQDALLVARAAAAAGQPRRALELLNRVETTDAIGAGERTAAFLAVGQHLKARGETAEALAAFERAALGEGREAREACVEAAKLAAAKGRHWKAAWLLVRALDRAGGPLTMRSALGELTALRLRRADPLAYEAAYAAALIDFAYLETGLHLAERLLPSVPADEPLRVELDARLADGYAALVAYCRRSGQVERALGLSRRWVGSARGRRAKARALAALAECHKLLGDRRSLVMTLTRLALEFPGTPEGGAARRELLRLQSGGTSTGGPR